MGDTKVNGLLKKLDDAWKAYADRDGVQALWRVHHDDMQYYVVFITEGNGYHISTELYRALGVLRSQHQDIRFDLQWRHANDYRTSKPNLEKKRAEGRAVRLYERASA